MHNYLRFSLLATVALPLCGQYTLDALLSSTKEYVVGAKLPPSGLFIKSPGDGWAHAGFNHPFIFSLDYSTDRTRVYLAAGNGLFEATNGGQKWKLLTGSDVTELRDVAVDRRNGAIYFGYCHGIRVSRDGGATWQEIGGSLHRKYTEAIRVDRGRTGVLLAGGEEGVFRSTDDGRTWRISGAGGFQITRIEQSPHNPCDWLAASQMGGLFASHDCGETFESTGRVGAGANLNDIAFDPSDAKRIAIAGWSSGVNLSEDGGLTWKPRNNGLPALQVTSVVFDPVKQGRLYASVNEEGLYASDDNGKTWLKDGLDGSVITRMRFVPEAAAK
jgi:photosystem II stability/assembly factor-like uncharacterized protein